MQAAMPCKKGTKKRTTFQQTEAKSSASNKIPKTKHACIVEAHESTRQRLESSLHKDHEDHIANTGYNSMTHNNLVHKSTPMPQGMKIPDAKAAVDKELEKLEKVASVAIEQDKEQNGGHPGRTQRENKSPLCFTDGHLSSQKC